MNVIYSQSFIKQLEKIGSIKINDVRKLLKKYPASKNIVEIDNIDNFKILKCYLLQKRIRMIVFFRTVKNNFIPIAVVRKVSKKGENISKENYSKLFNGEINKVFRDIENENYEIEQI